MTSGYIAKMESENIGSKDIVAALRNDPHDDSTITMCTHPAFANQIKNTGKTPLTFVSIPRILLKVVKRCYRKEGTACSVIQSSSSG